MKNKIKITHLALFNFLIFQLFCLVQITYAQKSSYKLITDGNAQYNQKKYSDAEVEYRKSLITGKNLKEGNYNLGNSYFKQGKYDEAVKQFESVGAMKDLSSEEKAKVYHNLGNSFLKDKKYEESIGAYKNALKANPKDNDTRYNLAYAQSMLQQQQDKNKNNKDDKNKDQKDKDKKDQEKKDNKENKENKDQQKESEKDQDKKDQDKNSQAQKDKISKDDADKILQALNNDEKKTQKKMNIKQPSKVSIEKQW